MDNKILVLMISALATFLIGFWGKAFVGMPDILLIFPAGTAAILLAVIVFGFSFVFFGYTAPLITLFAGIQLGAQYAASQEILAIVAASFAVILATTASINLGIALLDDLAEKGNFKKALNATGIVILLAVISAIASDMLSLGIISF